MSLMLGLLIETKYTAHMFMPSSEQVKLTVSLFFSACLNYILSLQPETECCYQK